MELGTILKLIQAVVFSVDNKRTRLPRPWICLTLLFLHTTLPRVNYPMTSHPHVPGLPITPAPGLLSTDRIQLQCLFINPTVLPVPFAFLSGPTFLSLTTGFDLVSFPTPLCNFSLFFVSLLLASLGFDPLSVPFLLDQSAFLLASLDLDPCLPLLLMTTCYPYTLLWLVWHNG